MFILSLCLVSACIISSRSRMIRTSCTSIGMSGGGRRLEKGGKRGGGGGLWPRSGRKSTISNLPTRPAGNTRPLAHEDIECEFLLILQWSSLIMNESEVNCLLTGSIVEGSPQGNPNEHMNFARQIIWLDYTSRGAHMAADSMLNTSSRMNFPFEVVPVHWDATK